MAHAPNYDNKDVELNEYTDQSIGSDKKTSPTRPVVGQDGYTDETRPSLMTRLGLTPASFKRRRLDDPTNQLNTTLKDRHLQMIAIGGSIGAGLFVGSGLALSRGGPGALLIDFALIGCMIL